MSEANYLYAWCSSRLIFYSEEEGGDEWGKERGRKRERDESTAESCIEMEGKWGIEKRYHREKKGRNY